MKLSSCCLCSLFPLCAACFLFVCAVCFLFACAVCFLFLCTVCFLFVCTVCFLFDCTVSSLCVQSVSFSATMVMRNKQRPHLHTVCVTACNVFQTSFCFSHSVSSCVGNRAEHFKLTGGFEGLLEPDLHCEALASYMRPLSSKRETVKLLSVQSVSSSVTMAMRTVCLYSYSIPMDRTHDMSYSLFHPYRQDL